MHVQGGKDAGAEPPTIEVMTTLFKTATGGGGGELIRPEVKLSKHKFARKI